jgi:hypothetical protein
MKLILFFLAFSSTFSLSLACSCVPPEALEKEYQRFGFVFVGTVGSARESLRDTKVEQAFKGVTKGATVFIASHRENLCGYEFKDGEKYLVFANEEPTPAGRESKALSVSLCSPTKRASQAKTDIRRLRKIAK